VVEREGDEPVRRRRGRVVWAVGLVTALLVADVAVGTVLGGPAGDAPAPLDAGAGLEGIAALEGLDYAPELFREQFVQGEGTYDALLGWRMEDTAGDHLNIVDGERVSRTTTAPGDPFVVWFFGGSTMYGFGQRDEHTIPSDLVDLAEAEGVALEAHNFGAQAYVNWQGVSLFAELLTERPAPDLAVFYDGYNDLSLQFVDGPVHEPSHALARVHRERLTAAPASDGATTASDIRAWWADHSGVTNLYRRLRDRFGGGDEPDLRLTEAEPSLVPEDVDPEAVVDAADDLLRRGRDLASGVAESYGVDVQFWFQPTLYTKPPVPGEVEVLERVAVRTPDWVPVTQAVRDRLPGDVVDLADVLDDNPDPLFWDAVHTNEVGARLIAEAAWPRVRAALVGEG
jgi:hypothetical protein